MSLKAKHPNPAVIVKELLGTSSNLESDFAQGMIALVGDESRVRTTLKRLLWSTGLR